MARYSQELDTCGLNCPLPILRAKKTLARMDDGEVLQVVATDPGSQQDFVDFSEQTGHVLLEQWETGGKYFFLIRKH